MTKRTIDRNGWMLVRDNPLTKVGVFPYMGHEIQGAPDPNKIYYVYRPAEELQKPETIDSFKLLPFIDEHEVLGKDATPAEQKGVCGVTGENVHYAAPYLRANLRVYSDAANALIETKQKVELSPGYRCKYDWTPGEFEGVTYDVVQRDIRANHLALVKEGRTGKDLVVQDHAIITIDTAEFIKMTLQELMEAIAALSEEERLQLMQSLQPAATEDELSDEEKAAAMATAEAAKEAEAAAGETAAAAEAAAETGSEEAAAVAAEAAAAAEEAAAIAAEEAATIDGLSKQVKALQKQLATMDSAHVMRDISKRDALAKRVSDYTGNFDHSGMTVDSVAQYGVKKLGIKCQPGTESIALDAWMQARQPDHHKTTSIAMDGKPNASVKGKFWSEAK